MQVLLAFHHFYFIFCMLLCNTLCNPFSQKSHICMYIFERCNAFLQAYFLFHKLVEKKTIFGNMKLSLST